jgi:hypothetical protein
MEKWFKDVTTTLGITEKNVFARRCGPPEAATTPERQATVGQAWKAATASASFAMPLFSMRRDPERAALTGLAPPARRV